MYTNEILKEIYRRELEKKNVLNDIIETVLSLIKESRKDGNLYRMENDCWKKLEEIDILNTFNEISIEQNIKWYHSNEPE